MKAYTDKEQSKKLAEILPIESADMYYHPYPNDEDWYDSPNIGNADLKYNQLPCWSLAALLDILPLEMELLKQSDGNIKYYYMEYTTKKIYFASKRYTNSIDAAFEIVCWLKENKMNLL